MAGNQIEGYGEEGPGMTFHYKQGSFREREDSATRDLATGASLNNKGLFRTLVGTKGNRTMFMVLILAFIVVLMVSLFAKGSSASLGALQCDLTAFSYEDTVYASLHVSGKRERGQKALTVTFRAIDSDGAVSAGSTKEALYDPADGEGLFVRASFPDYDIAQVVCTVEPADGDEPGVQVSADVRRY